MRAAGAAACVAHGDDADELVRAVRELGAGHRKPIPSSAR
jgi:hypothetical protein